MLILLSYGNICEPHLQFQFLLGMLIRQKKKKKHMKLVVRASFIYSNQYPKVAFQHVAPAAFKVLSSSMYL